MMLHSSFISNWAGCVAHFTEAEMVHDVRLSTVDDADSHACKISK
jgi:hypothetical protein